MNTKVIEFIRGINDGGAETLVKDYSVLMDKSRISPIIVALYVKPSANLSIIKENKIKLIVLYKKWNFFIKLFNYILGRWYVCFRLKRIIKKEEPIAIHAHMTVLRYLSKIRSTLKGVRLFYTCHSLPEKYFGGVHKNEYYAAKELINDNNLHLIGLHREMADQLNRMFNITNSIYINNGINFEKYINTEMSKTLIRETIGIPKDAFVIGHIGRFHSSKNHSFLIQVFREVRKKDPNAFLLLIGNGEGKEKIETQIRTLKLSDHVKILSNRSDVPELLNSMDVFLFPSKFEGFGIVMIEAQLAGLKCVASLNVPEATYVSNRVIALSLEESMDKWVQAITTDEISYEKPQYDINDYNMNNIIRRVEDMYLGRGQYFDEINAYR